MHVHFITSFKLHRVTWVNKLYLHFFYIYINKRMAKTTKNLHQENQTCHFFLPDLSREREHQFTTAHAKQLLLVGVILWCMHLCQHDLGVFDACAVFNWYSCLLLDYAIYSREESGKYKGAQEIWRKNDVTPSPTTTIDKSQILLSFPQCTINSSLHREYKATDYESAGEHTSVHILRASTLQR